MLSLQNRVRFRKKSLQPDVIDFQRITALFVVQNFNIVISCVRCGYIKAVYRALRGGDVLFARAGKRAVHCCAAVVGIADIGRFRNRTRKRKLKIESVVLGNILNMGNQIGIFPQKQMVGVKSSAVLRNGRFNGAVAAFVDIEFSICKKQPSSLK